MASRLVRDYVDAAVAHLRRLNLMRSPGGVPDSMLDPSIPPSQDWVGWKPMPSTVMDGDLDGLERETGLRFPPAYRDFLKCLHFIDLTEVGVRFEQHMPQNWCETLRAAYFKSWPRETILDVGLIPFGDETQLDAGPVCFDTRCRLADGDCPVVFWDHEWRGTNKEVQPMFSSSAKMFECLTLIARADISSFQGGLLTRFLSMDPEGAGSAARNYWVNLSTSSG